MAIGTGAALLGTAVIGAGSSIIGNREQADAISDAQYANDQASNRALNLQRETRDIQIANAEPFRQFGLQQANFLSEIFGGQQFQDQPSAGAPGSTVPTSGPNYDAYVGNHSDLESAYNGLTPAQSGYAIQRGFDANGDGQLSRGEYGNFHYTTYGQGEGRQIPSYGEPYAGSDKLPTQDADVAPANDGANPAVNSGAQQTALDRFQGSMFNDALQGQLGRAATGVDANFAASGNVYSGAREQAQQNTAADLGMGALGMYLNTMMGQPSTSGAQMASSAAGQYGANAGNIVMQQGQNAANSAYAQGQNTNDLVNNLGGLASFGLGAYSKPGGGFFGWGG